MFTKDVAMHHGCKTMTEAVEYFCPRVKPGGSLVIAWGELGACGWDSSGGMFTCSPFTPSQGVVDTLGNVMLPTDIF